MTSGEPARGRARPTSVTETLVAGAMVGAAPEKLDMTADEAVTQLYSNHYRSLVRLAAAPGGRQGAFLPEAGRGEPVPVGAAAPQRGGPQRAQAGAGHAERRTG